MRRTQAVTSLCRIEHSIHRLQHTDRFHIPWLFLLACSGICTAVRCPSRHQSCSVPTPQRRSSVTPAPAARGLADALLPPYCIAGPVGFSSSTGTALVAVDLCLVFRDSCGFAAAGPLRFVDGIRRVRRFLSQQPIVRPCSLTKAPVTCQRSVQPVVPTPRPSPRASPQDSHSGRSSLRGPSGGPHGRSVLPATARYCRFLWFRFDRVPRPPDGAKLSHTVLIVTQVLLRALCLAQPNQLQPFPFKLATQQPRSWNSRPTSPKEARPPVLLLLRTS